MKRGYFVHGYDETWGIAIVASTAREAKNIAYAELHDEEWIDIRVRWIKNVYLEGLDTGIVHNLRDGLLRGFFGYIEGWCDNCGNETELEVCSGKALCFDCMEKEYKREDVKN